MPKKGFDTRRFVDLFYQEKKGLASTVSIRYNKVVVISPLPYNLQWEWRLAEVLTSTMTVFTFGASPSSIIQSNLGLSPSWLIHLEWNDGLASIYDIDFDIWAKSSSPTSDACEEGASTTAGNPSETPPDEKGPENEAVITGGTVSLSLYVWV